MTDIIEEKNEEKLKGIEVNDKNPNISFFEQYKSSPFEQFTSKNNTFLTKKNNSDGNLFKQTSLFNNSNTDGTKNENNKNGEEDDDILFKKRAKAYKFDSESQKYNHICTGPLHINISISFLYIL